MKFLTRQDYLEYVKKEYKDTFSSICTYIPNGKEIDCFISFIKKVFNILYSSDTGKNNLRSKQIKETVCFYPTEISMPIHNQKNLLMIGKPCEMWVYDRELRLCFENEDGEVFAIRFSDILGHELEIIEYLESVFE